MPLPLEDYIGAGKNTEWIRDVVAEWKLDRSTGGGDFALGERLRRHAEESPDAALKLFVSLSEQATDDAERVALAEELEWLLAKHGAAYWDTLNALCARLPQFRAVMANVWGANLSNDLKRKIEMWRS